MIKCLDIKFQLSFVNHEKVSIDVLYELLIDTLFKTSIDITVVMSIKVLTSRLYE